MSGPTAAQALEVRGLTVGYGQAPVLHEIDLDVPSGEVVAVLGPNGAGKSTLLKTVSGLLQPVSGSAHFGDTPLGGRDAEAIAALGIAHVPEGRRIFPRRTVTENLLLGGWVRRRDASLGESCEMVFERFPALAARRHQLAGALSGGEAQMLAIAMALVARPRLVLLDEPSQGLAPKIIDLVFDEIARLRAERISVVIAEQRFHRSLSVADRVAVLSRGSMVVSGLTADEAASFDFRRAYLGEDPLPSP